MMSIGPIATYVGLAGMVVGTLGVAVDSNKAAPELSLIAVSYYAEILEFTRPLAIPGAASAPELVPIPVAFYEETLELITPPRMNVSIVNAAAPEKGVVPIEEYEDRPIRRVRVHRRGRGVEEFVVRQERRRSPRDINPFFFFH
jgi:hypothetical protein